MIEPRAPRPTKTQLLVTCRCTVPRTTAIPPVRRCRPAFSTLFSALHTAEQSANSNGHGNRRRWLNKPDRRLRHRNNTLALHGRFRPGLIW
jgi:hypothetical protein